MNETPDTARIWRDAVRIVQALAVAPECLGGIRVIAAPSPPRDALLELLKVSLHGRFEMRRVPPTVSDEALHGAVDLATTLRAGHTVRSKGLLNATSPTLLLVPMAERIDGRLAGRLVQAMDVAPGGMLACVALDEGIDATERSPEALNDRLAAWIDLRPMQSLAPAAAPLSLADLERARRQLPGIVVGDDAVGAICVAALRLGIASLRPAIAAVHTARISAALEGRDAVAEDDLAFAARVVLGPRAVGSPSDDQTSTAPEPSQAEDTTNPPPTNPAQDSDTQRPSQESEHLEDVVVAAASATLPDGLLMQEPGTKRAAASRGNGKSGARRTSRRRGRPLGSRPGTLAQGRLDLLATLKAAAPWQRLRAHRGSTNPTVCIAVRRADFHVRRLQERTESLTIFIVDASGSTAAQRLAEAKGAVEILLADCYVRRDQVALISFRKAEADLVLPPTRSLARAKRLLMEMPAGGGTPLGSAIVSASTLADSARRSGLQPLMVFLTDGGANIAQDGSPDRARAEEDARRAARRSASLGLDAMLIDVSFRNRAFTHELSSLLGARHISLPRADATALARAVEASHRPS